MTLRPEQVAPYVRETGSDPSPTDDFASGYARGSLWKNTSTDVVYESVNDAAAAAVWVVTSAPVVTQSEAEAGLVTEPRIWTPERVAQAIAELSAGDVDYFSVRDATGGKQFANPALYENVEFDTVDETTASFSLNGTTGAVTANVTAVMFVFFSVTMDEQSGNNRSDWETELYINNVVSPGWGGFVYSRNNAQGKGTLTKGRLVAVTSGDVLEVRARPASGNNDFEAVADRCTFTGFTLKGQKGDKGDPGSGSSITIEDGGSPVGVFDTINIVGGSVTDAGGGTADVNILPVFGNDYQYVESTPPSSTGSNVYQTKVGLTTPNGLNGTYRIGWSYLGDQTNTADYFQGRLFNVTDGVAIGGDPLFEPEDQVDTHHFGGFAQVSFSGSAKTFEIQWREQSGGIAIISEARIEIWRVA